MANNIPFLTRRQQWRMLKRRRNSKKLNTNYIFKSPLNFISVDEYNEEKIIGYCRYIEKKVTFYPYVEVYYFNN
jgi:hypothetical protein